MKLDASSCQTVMGNSSAKGALASAATSGAKGALASAAMSGDAGSVASEPALWDLAHEGVRLCIG